MTDHENDAHIKRALRRALDRSGDTVLPERLPLRLVELAIAEAVDVLNALPDPERAWHLPLCATWPAVTERTEPELDEPPFLERLCGLVGEMATDSEAARRWRRVPPEAVTDYEAVLLAIAGLPRDEVWLDADGYLHARLSPRSIARIAATWAHLMPSLEAEAV
jgi:hypothetical protein